MIRLFDAGAARNDKGKAPARWDNNWEVRWLVAKGVARNLAYIYRFKWRRHAQWFKLKFASDMANTHDIGGLDLVCVGKDISSDENQAQQKSGLAHALSSSAALQMVQFGPVPNAKIPPPFITKAYLQQRKMSCNWPKV